MAQEITRSSFACPLCGSGRTPLAACVDERRYFRCEVCRLVFLSPDQRLDPDAERARYDLHENDPNDPRYRRFLSRVADPLVRVLPKGAEGLDYGSGPGPTLSAMLEEKGFSMAVYDPFYAPDPAPLERTYDFITCTETVEHFYAPGEEFARFDRLLRPGGLLAVMTVMVRDDRSFKGWWYIREPSHVCFYHRRTMEWIATRYGWTCRFPHPNVTIMRKTEASAERQPGEQGKR